MLTKSEIKKLAEFVRSSGELEFCFQMSEDFSFLWNLDDLRFHSLTPMYSEIIPNSITHILRKELKS